MSMDTSSFTNALNLPLRKIFFDEYNEAEQEYTGWVNVGTLDKNYEEDWKVGGFGSVPTKTQGASVTFQDAVSGSLKRYTSVSFGLGFRITWEMWEDDQTGIMKQMTRQLARSFKNLFEVRAARILNNATSTSSEFLGLDSLALLNTAHPLLATGGSTYANKPTVDVDISYTAVQAAIQNFYDIKDESNFPKAIYPDKALVTVSDMHKARELFANELQPGTANNDRNLINQGPGGVKGYQILRYLTDSDTWFIIAPKKDHSMNFLVRSKPAFHTFDDPETADIKVRGLARCVSGFSDWRGVYGSTGG